MNNLTLIIPAKKESESLPIFINELKDFTENMSGCILPDLNESLETIKIFDLARQSNG